MNTRATRIILLITILFMALTLVACQKPREWPTHKVGDSEYHQVGTDGMRVIYKTQDGKSTMAIEEIGNGISITIDDHDSYVLSQRSFMDGTYNVEVKMPDGRLITYTSSGVVVGNPTVSSSELQIIDDLKRIYRQQPQKNPCGEPTVRGLISSWASYSHLWEHFVSRARARCGTSTRAGDLKLLSQVISI